MKRALVLVLVFALFAFAFAQDAATAVSVVNDAAKVWQTDPSGAARGIAGGVDLDGDGYLEFYATNYDYGNCVVGFEAIGGDTLEYFWRSDTTNAAAMYSSGTRFVQTGDIDGDGEGEVIFFRGRYSTVAEAGLYIYEIAGDNTFKPLKFYSIDDLSQLYNFNGEGTTIAFGTVEHFVVRDVDKDGYDEIIYAMNGATYVTDRIDTTATDTTAYGHSEDFFAVLSATDDLQGFGRLQSEFITSARDIDMGVLGLDKNDPFFGRDLYSRGGRILGGGSAVAVEVCDTDGDDLNEIACFVWNYNNVFFVEATGPNTYSFGDTTHQYLTGPDGVCLLQPVVGDVDGDGNDEVYYNAYPAYETFQIKDLNGDATNFDTTEFTIINGEEGDPTGSWCGGVVGDVDGDGNNELIMGNSMASGDINVWDGTSWETYYSVEPDTNMYYETVAGANHKFVDKLTDIDNDGFMEIICAYQGEVDSIHQIVGTDTNWVANPFFSPIRVIEFGDDELGTVTSINPVVISPDDFKLEEAYPNPFNPTTSISYYLPIAKEISLKVYNLRGELVSVLVDNQRMEAGTHNVVWNATDMNGSPLSTGVYVYSLTYGNFTKSHKVTLLK
ncbi:MAG: T9SS type A sorting domain-containing protein [Candidatus Marinimicrobia bacterium]|nr:T9SS type A sorting domain-containing protein [Candidatus Neomarinimicrobiota bacterium]